jgi:hypothetical protein
MLFNQFLYFSSENTRNYTYKTAIVVNKSESILLIGNNHLLYDTYEGVHFFSITLCNLAMFYFGIQISNNIVETTVCLQHVLYNEHDENLEFDIS